MPVAEQHVEAAIEGRPTLGEDQEEMVRRLCTSTVASASCHGA
jgi:hypothetical protein